MILTIFKIAVLRLWNNKQEVVLALLVPVLFFSIFAIIFGEGIGSDLSAIDIAVVDDDQSSLTERIKRLVREQPAIRMRYDRLTTSQTWPLEKLAKAAIRGSTTDVVIHLPAGLERTLRENAKVSIPLLSEGTNPISEQLVTAMLTQVVSRALLDQSPSMDQRPSVAAPNVSMAAATPRVTAYASNDLSRLPPADDRAANPTPLPATQAPPPANPIDLISFSTADVFSKNKHNPKIAMYAAGIAVMFLLFSATGAGGSLLEEQEAGTLDRLLSSQLTLSKLLAGKWLFITCLGCVQLSVMFVWAQLAFGVQLTGHLPGFAVMTLCTAAATASLALCLATACGTRTQLNGVSIVLILTMSALGGSMVPRYIMSEQMQRLGQFTFNSWALDGFKKVFWYDLPVSALRVEVTVLLVMTIVLAVVARTFADRWANA